MVVVVTVIDAGFEGVAVDVIVQLGVGVAGVTLTGTIKYLSKID